MVGGGWVQRCWALLGARLLAVGSPLSGLFLGSLSSGVNKGGKGFLLGARLAVGSPPSGRRCRCRCRWCMMEGMWISFVQSSP